MAVVKYDNISSDHHPPSSMSVVVVRMRMRSDRGLDSVIHSRRTSLIHHHWPQARTACVRHSVVSVSMQQLEPRGGAYYSGNSLGVWRISYSRHRSTPTMVVVVMVKAMVRVRKLQDWNNVNSNPMVSV